MTQAMAPNPDTLATKLSLEVSKGHFSSGIVQKEN
jgi:hypothetical protein